MSLGCHNAPTERQVAGAKLPALVPGDSWDGTATEIAGAKLPGLLAAACQDAETAGPKMPDFLADAAVSEIAGAKRPDLMAATCRDGAAGEVLPDAVTGDRRDGAADEVCDAKLPDLVASDCRDGGVASEVAGAKLHDLVVAACLGGAAGEVGDARLPDLGASDCRDSAASEAAGEKLPDFVAAACRDGTASEVAGVKLPDLAAADATANDVTGKNVPEFAAAARHDGTTSEVAGGELPGLAVADCGHDTVDDAEDATLQDIAAADRRDGAASEIAVAKLPELVPGDRREGAASDIDGVIAQESCASERRDRQASTATEQDSTERLPDGAATMDSDDECILSKKFAIRNAQAACGLKGAAELRDADDDAREASDAASEDEPVWSAQRERAKEHLRALAAASLARRNQWQPKPEAPLPGAAPAAPKAYAGYVDSAVLDDENEWNKRHMEHCRDKNCQLCKRLRVQPSPTTAAATAAATAATRGGTGAVPRPQIVAVMPQPLAAGQRAGSTALAADAVMASKRQDLAALRNGPATKRQHKDAGSAMPPSTLKLLWRKQVPLLYDVVAVHRMAPAVSALAWCQGCARRQGTMLQRLIVATSTAGGHAGGLRILSVRLPWEKGDDGEEDQRGTAATSAPTQPATVRTTHAMPHEGEARRIECSPHKAMLFATQAESGDTLIFDASRWPAATPASFGLGRCRADRRLRAGACAAASAGRAAHGSGLSWSAQVSSHLASSAFGGAVRLWDITTSSVLAQFSGGAAEGARREM
eukprot:NODE_1794_length_2372_cov_2.349666.p1 GENE.NODE_1794_length_2372_cov_2.349666~~NODE_1794_length_2372_cov_2.349666.p1  ORF type:complete len:786 (+),score=230.88 NODE_1794_length_2372_cov_2.349666:63-2360(+)